MIYSLVKIDEHIYAVREQDLENIRYVQPEFHWLFGRKVVGVMIGRWSNPEYVKKYCYLTLPQARTLFNIVCREAKEKEKLRTAEVLHKFSAN